MKLSSQNQQNVRTIDSQTLELNQCRSENSQLQAMLEKISQQLDSAKEELDEMITLKKELEEYRNLNRNVGFKVCSCFVHAKILFFFISWKETTGN